jgi:hypothetical protein
MSTATDNPSDVSAIIRILGTVMNLAKNWSWKAIIETAKKERVQSALGEHQRVPTNPRSNARQRKSGYEYGQRCVPLADKIDSPYVKHVDNTLDKARIGYDDYCRPVRL